MSMKGLKKSEQIEYLETLGMQCKPTGKIAEMEGKMSDMTENWRKNMQNLAKQNLFLLIGSDCTDDALFVAE
ncbi:unnamed protein product [Peronospora belbahrii]|uniref:Uncharacterized protein n=1 Tax=Peronospora belbahrii TaxID=622444 RepID=A0ABN8CN23_9STRA|nr:unnamed protein product [Peronospora belbahrii]